MVKQIHGGHTDYEKLIKIISGSYPDFKLFNQLFNEDNSDVIVNVQDIKHELPYIANNKIKKPQVHLGQRKLLLTEIQFLTKIPTGYCIYAGAAPGNKTNYLSELFPDVKFILVDPNEFNINFIKDGKRVSHRKYKHDNIISIYNHFPTKSNIYDGYTGHKTKEDIANIVEFIRESSYNIYIVEDYMTNDLAEGFAALGDVSFISDIRSNITDTEHPANLDIYWNSSLQYNWIYILQPVISMLKMRMPFGSKPQKIPQFVQDDFDMSNGLDFKDMYINGTFKFSKSQQYVQAWPGISSTEMRFHITREDISNIVSYDIAQIESKFFYYNSINRGWIYHDNANADPSLHFCHCNDCALENNILTEYDSDNVHKMVREIDIITMQPLNKRHTINTYIDDDIKQKITQISNQSQERRYNKNNQRGESGKSV